MKFAGNKAYFKLRNAEELKTVVEEAEASTIERKLAKKQKAREQVDLSDLRIQSASEMYSSPGYASSIPEPSSVPSQYILQPAPQLYGRRDYDSYIPQPPKPNISNPSHIIQSPMNEQPIGSYDAYEFGCVAPPDQPTNPNLSYQPYDSIPPRIPTSDYKQEFVSIAQSAEINPPKLMRRVSSCESIADYDLNRSFHSNICSSDEEQEQEEVKQQYQLFSPSYEGSQSQSVPSVLPKENRRYRFQVDTNVVEVDLGTLAQAQNIATGDAVFCKECRATLSVHSKLNPAESEGYLWICEFCDAENAVNLEEEEIPTGDTMDYLLMSASQKAEEEQGFTEENKDISIVFCIDISGSMCVSKPVEGAIQLKTLKKQVDLGGFNDFDINEQFMADDRGVTYISRLQCVQAAIDAQIEAMSKATPLRKVGLVTFNNEVTIIGDGSQDPYTLTGDKLYNYQQCLDMGKQHSNSLDKTIQDAKDVLSQKLMNLWEGGSTAIGPALLASIGLASNRKIGSKVIICTDGLANVGIGSLDSFKTTEEKLQAEEFYTKVANLAKESGLSISVLSIEGEECSIESLSKLAEFTGGDIERVDPLNLSNEFANILSTPIIATQVSAKVKIHKGLMFRSESEEFENGTSLVKEIGNVTSNSKFTFEFSLRPKEEVEAMGLNLEAIKQLVFQTQIHYTTLQGMRCMRTITAIQDVTDNLEEAIQDINLEVIGTNAAIQSANYAKRGDYRGSQAVMRAWKNMMSKNVKSPSDYSNYAHYVDNMAQMHNELQSVQAMEVEQQGRRLSIHDDSIPQGEVKRMRKELRGDKLSNMAFKAERGKKDCIIF